MALTEIDKYSDTIIVFPELFLTGYPPTDDLFFSELRHDISHAIDALIQKSLGVEGLIIIGAPFYDGNHWRNAALAIAKGRVIHRHDKVCLPNYDVFNDARYFVPGDTVQPFEWNNQLMALVICEDIWANVHPTQYVVDPVIELANKGVGTIIHLTASPFDIEKLNQRITQMKRVTDLTGAFVVSVNQVGGYSELLFDGQSLVVDSTGVLVRQFPAFESISETIQSKPELPKKAKCFEDQLIDAISFGLKEYMANAGFSSVLVGLSGGIDSAVVAALAVHAIGANNVHLVTMPTQFNSNETKQDAMDMAHRCGCDVIQLPIEALRSMLESDISHGVGGALNDIAKQNIQARLRGLILMALSNQTGGLLLTTGNKSELAMGYATLYGDMCGGLNILGDCFKTEVVKLAQRINARYGWIPTGIIDRPPSAELAPNQTDEDTLPPYHRLDQILIGRIINGFSFNQLLEMNDKKDVEFVLKRLKKNEFKRFQSPPILKLSSKSFGKGWQFPLVR
jgi:NAD+ synthetase